MQMNGKFSRPKKAPVFRILVDARKDLRNYGKIWRRIARYAYEHHNNTKAAKLFWRELSLGSEEGFRNVSAGAKKVKELVKFRKLNASPFDGRIMECSWPEEVVSSDYEGYLPEDDFDENCSLGKYYGQQRPQQAHVSQSKKTISREVHSNIALKRKASVTETEVLTNQANYNVKLEHFEMPPFIDESSTWTTSASRQPVSVEQSVSSEMLNPLNDAESEDLDIISDAPKKTETVAAMSLLCLSADFAPQSPL
jgi:hypothetical protein